MQHSKDKDRNKLLNWKKKKKKTKQKKTTTLLHPDMDTLFGMWIPQWWVDLYTSHWLINLTKSVPLMFSLKSAWTNSWAESNCWQFDTPCHVMSLYCIVYWNIDAIILTKCSSLAAQKVLSKWHFHFSGICWCYSRLIVMSATKCLYCLTVSVNHPLCGI